MFVSTKDQGSPRRRGHPYGAGKAAQTSKLSLLSSFTTISGGSSESTSTVTQESYNRMQKDQQPKTRSKKRRPREMKEEISKVVARIPANKSEKEQDIDVFEFLVEEEASKQKEPSKRLASIKKPTPSKETIPTKESETAKEIEPIEEVESDEEESSEEDSAEEDIEEIPEGDSGTHEDSSDPEGYYRGHLSDSGISMGSNSTGEPAHFDAVVKAPLPPVIEEVPDRRQSFTYSTGDSPYYRTDSPMTWYHVHGGGYGREQIPLSPAGSIGNILPYEYAKDVSDPAPGNESSSCIKSTPLIFRDKHVGSSPSPPVFRSFAKVNGRVLLQMQANIAELEHELTLLDNKTVSTETSPKHKKSDPNRIRRHTLRDQARREYLYQELHVSLDQYYQSLYATHRIAHITSSPTSSEATNFRKWLQTHLLSSSRFASLLGDGTDLISLNTTSDENLSPTFRVIAFSILVNIFFPLLVFKFMSSILSRLIFLSLVMAAGSLALDKVDVKIDLLHRNCIIAFAGISVGAALFC